MPDSFKNSLDNLNVNSLSEDEIDHKEIYRTLIRNRKIIFISTISGLLISGFLSLITKRTWQGEFQIVVEQNENLPEINSSVSKLLDFSSASNSKGIKTEVEILRSPSVLINVFDFFKKKKLLKNEKYENYTFKAWKSNLDIQLEKGTRVLNIRYKDKDKNIILPVLNRISDAYQEYSGRNRLRQIELAINYFEEQISLYQNKSDLSRRKAQKFAIDQDFSILQGESNFDLDIPAVINIESIRVQAANEIRVIDTQLEQIKELKGDDEQIMYISSTIPNIDNLSSNLKDIDTLIERYSTNYKIKDKLIQDLMKEKAILISLAKRQVTGFLQAQKLDAQSRLKASERPEGVLIKYRKLLSDARKDKSTLNGLEDKYRSILLEKARTEDPWKLITNPVLLPQPVGPRRKRMLALGLLGGAFVGTAGVIINDKRKNIIYSIDEMETRTQWPLLAELSLLKKDSMLEFFNLITTGVVFKNDGTIALVPVGGIKNSLLNKVTHEFGNYANSPSLINTSDTIEISKCAAVIVVASLGKINKEELTQLRKKLFLNKKEVLGFILLNDNVLNA